MAWHSKRHNIKHRKESQDAKKQKVYSLHSKLIALGAISWIDPDKNPNLAKAIKEAKQDWVPNDNIDRAIKRASPDNKDLLQIYEIIYEWYAPWWVAVLVHTLTDNKNRTASNIRHIFTKYGWNLWESWTVSWLFKRKGLIIINPLNHNYDDVEKITFDTEAQDIVLEDDMIKIITLIDDLDNISLFLKEKWIDLEYSEVDYIPDNKIEITDFDKALKLKKNVWIF